MKLSDEEKWLLLQQKLIFHLITFFVPKNSKAGFFEDPYTGLQGEINLLKNKIFQLVEIFFIGWSKLE